MTASKCDGSCGKCKPGVFSPCEQCGHPQDHDFGGCWHPGCPCRVYSFPLTETTPQSLGWV